MPKEHARHLFRIVLKNADLFGEFRVALSELKQDEAPYMWLVAQAETAHEARVLVTESRVLVFRVRGFRGPPLEMVGEYPFQGLSGEPTLLRAGRKTTFYANFDVQGSHLLVLGGLPFTIAEQLKTFVALPSEQRVLVVHRRAPELLGLEPTRRGLPSQELGADRKINCDEDSGGPARVAAPGTHESTPEEVVTDGEQTPIRPRQDQAAEPMHGISRERARELFERIERNTGFLAEFRVALQHLGEDEHPYMWLFVQVRGLPEARLLLTDRRMMIFRVRLFSTQRLSLVCSPDLSTLVGRPALKKAGERAMLEVAFDAANHTSLVLEDLSTLIGEKVERFMNLSATQRTCITALAADGERDQAEEDAGPRRMLNEPTYTHNPFWQPIFEAFPWLECFNLDPVGRYDKAKARLQYSDSKTLARRIRRLRGTTFVAMAVFLMLIVLDAALEKSGWGGCDRMHCSRHDSPCRFARGRV